MNYVYNTYPFQFFIYNINTSSN